MVLLQLERYRFVKESSSSGILDNPITSGRTILMANEDGKRIAIKDYIAWLRCNYGINLTTKYTDSNNINISQEKLCANNFKLP